MKTIVIGFNDKLGAGPAELLAGPEVPPKDQLKIVNSAKFDKQFPKGIQYVALGTWEPSIIAIDTSNPEPKKKKT